MKTRWIFAGLAVVAMVALTAGLALAAGRGTAGPSTPDTSWSRMVAACDAVHDSPAMARMREQMPAAAQAQCEAMHEQMGQMMGDSGMMGGFGNGLSSGMMGGAAQASHHPLTSAGR